MDDSPRPRRIYAASVLTALSCLTAFGMVGTYLPRTRDVFEQVKIPIPALTGFFLMVPGPAWIVLGALLAAFLIGKDLRYDEKRAGQINQIATPLLFLFALAAFAALHAPMYSLMEGIGGRRR
jgi:type II secretory pathway component PulF